MKLNYQVVTDSLLARPSPCPAQRRRERRSKGLGSGRTGRPAGQAGSQCPQQQLQVPVCTRRMPRLCRCRKLKISEGMA